MDTCDIINTRFAITTGASQRVCNVCVCVESDDVNLLDR